MSSVFNLDSEQCTEILKCAIGHRIPAIMSYMSKNKWHVAKVTIVGRTEQTLRLESMHEASRHHPLNIQMGQPVGISFKHAYAKFVFDTTIQSLLPSSDRSKGGTIEVATPTKIEAIQRRSYFRVNVPTGLQVNVTLWHRTGRCQDPEQAHKYYSGHLMDLSAGGAQMALTQQDSEGAHINGSVEFRKGQFIGIRFTPLPYETPLMFNAQIRTVLPTADDSAVCLGLQLVGLEASAEGRETLSRIAEVVDTYHQINQGELPLPLQEHRVVDLNASPSQL
ncbi:flagellar brake protein [Planctomycetota bacterium]